MTLNWKKDIALTAVVLVNAFLPSSPPLKENFFWILAFVLFRWFFISISWFFSIRRDGGGLHPDEELAAILIRYVFTLALFSLWAKPLRIIVKVVLTTTPPTLWEGLITVTIVVISIILSWRVYWRPRLRQQLPFDQLVDQQPAEGDMAIGWNMMAAIRIISALMYMLVDDLLKLFFATKWSLEWLFIYVFTINIVLIFARHHRHCHRLAISRVATDGCAGCGGGVAPAAAATI